MRISPDQLDHYLTHGYAIVPGFLTPSEVQNARDDLLRYYPTAEELDATPNRYGGILEDPEHLQTEFPFDGDALNHISTHPELIDFVEKVLAMSPLPVLRGRARVGAVNSEFEISDLKMKKPPPRSTSLTAGQPSPGVPGEGASMPNVLLSQAAIWAKYAGTGDFEQGMHLDYQGNSLVVPRDDGDYRQVNAILYYTDVTEELGPTCVVSKTQTADRPLWPPFRTRKKDPEIYRIEKKVTTPAGGLLLFGMRTWHRASAMTAEFGERFSHHMVWRAARHGFQGYHHWPHFGEKAEMQAFIARATPRQREILGFPRAGDPYWNEETLAAVALRYPKMDMTPYLVKSTR